MLRATMQGLKQLVAMVADLPLPKPSSAAAPMGAYGQPPPPTSPPPATAPPGESPGLALSQVAVNCIFLFLDCYNILPHNYLCRLLAQNGLVPRLFVVLKEVRAGSVPLILPWPRVCLRFVHALCCSFFCCWKR